MLTKVVLQNFKSFKQETEFDLSETKYQVLKQENTFQGVLKGALFIGSNASGKSNLMKAITLLLDLMLRDNVTISPIMMCMFDTKPILHLAYHFKFEGGEVCYKIEASNKGLITFEQLTLNGAVVLDRKGGLAKVTLNGNDIFFDEKVLPNSLFLKKAYFSSVFMGVKLVDQFIDYLLNSVYFNAHEKKVVTYNNRSLVLEQLAEADLDEINKFFDTFNLGYSIIKTKRQEVYSGKQEQGKNAQIVFQTEVPLLYLQRANMNLTLPLNFESLGNQTLLHLLPCYLHACKTPSMLLIDEFSSGFHNTLEELIIKQFMLNSKNSQLIFSSHSTNLLDTKLLRPDQIYTVEFVPNVGSVISRVSSESPRETQNLEKMYLSGKFGGVPKYDD